MALGCLGEPPEMLFHCRVARRKHFQWSDGEYECLIAILVESGRFRFALRGKTDEAAKNDIVFFPAHERFQREVIESVQFHHIGFAAPKICSGWDELCGKYTFKDKLRVASTVKLLTHLSDITEVETSTAEQKHLARDLLFQIAIEQKMSPDGDVQCKDPVINSVCTSIKSNLSCKLSFEQLAKEHGLTHVQLIRRFSKEMGMTPGKYLSEQRLKLAYQLLTSGALTVAETAELCGFESQFYLSQCFKKHFGITPTEAKSGKPICNFRI